MTKYFLGSEVAKEIRTGIMIARRDIKGGHIRLMTYQESIELTMSILLPRSAEAYRRTIMTHIANLHRERLNASQAKADNDVRKIKHLMERHTGDD